MFNRILIANRGEIAVRIIRCCREMEIETVAVYSEADSESLHVQLATKAVCIGKAKANESYLNQSNIIMAALKEKCDAIHPGYGFLSENSNFANLCKDNGIEFIGPSGDIIDQLGNKDAARKIVSSNGVPIVPGSKKLIEDADMAAEVAREIGFPILIKASAGGGGRGMRRAYNKEELTDAFNAARKEAIACFGNGDMYIEKLVIAPKHIEVQILADKLGNVIHLGERNCSIQRKNQKMIEESPAKISEDLRADLGQSAINAAKAANYFSAGTVEFILDESGNYYFIEMNTRVQVEHPVSELVSGVDIIKEQIRIAYGLKLNYTQDDIQLKGCAIECRINAEDPKENFRASIGKIGFLHFPGGSGVRVDSYLYSGYEISPYYDSLLAKIIVYAPNRLAAIRKMRRALEELIIEGVETTCELEHLILFQKEFLKGNYNVDFIENKLDEIMSLENY